MKTIYSFNEFFEKAVLIAAKKGIDYVNVEVKKAPIVTCLLDAMRMASLIMKAQLWKWR